MRIVDRLKEINIPTIEFNSLFIAYLAYMFFCGSEMIALITVAVVLIHEIGHFIVGKMIGKEYSGIVLYPFGAVIEEEDYAPIKNEWIVAISGPAINLICAGIFGILLIYNPLNKTIIEVINANVTIALFNLLPIYPLDGARAILSISEKPMRMIKTLRIAGIVVSFIMILIFFATIFYKVNYSFLILGTFLLIGSIKGFEKEMSVRIAQTLLSNSKKYKKGVPITCIAFSEDTPTYQVLNKINQSKITDIEVISQNKRIGKITEKEFLDFVTHSSSQSKLKDLVIAKKNTK